MIQLFMANYWMVEKWNWNCSVTSGLWLCKWNGKKWIWGDERWKWRDQCFKRQQKRILLILINPIPVINEERPIQGNYGSELDYNPGKGWTQMAHTPLGDPAGAPVWILPTASEGGTNLAVKWVTLQKDVASGFITSGWLSADQKTMSIVFHAIHHPSCCM